MASCDEPECREYHPECSACREPVNAVLRRDGSWRPIGGHFYEPHHCSDTFRVTVARCPVCKGELIAMPGFTLKHSCYSAAGSLALREPRRFLPETRTTTPADRTPNPDIEQEVRQAFRPQEKSDLFD